MLMDFVVICELVLCFKCLLLFVELFFISNMDRGDCALADTYRFLLRCTFIGFKMLQTQHQICLQLVRGRVSGKHELDNTSIKRFRLSDDLCEFEISRSIFGQLGAITSTSVPPPSPPSSPPKYKKAFTEVPYIYSARHLAGTWCGNESQISDHQLGFMFNLQLTRQSSTPLGSADLRNHCID